MDYLNIIFQEVYKILFLLVPVLVSVAMIVWLDRRVWAFVQKRQGPNVVGPFGLLQSLADALKYIFKEIIIPSSSNKVIFILAPIVKSINGSAAEPKSSVVSIITLMFCKPSNENNNPAIIAKIKGFLKISKNTFTKTFFESFWPVWLRLITIIIMIIIFILGT